VTRLRSRLPGLALALVLLVPALVGGHVDELPGVSHARVSAHGHGPWAPCPDVKRHDCLACATESVLAPAPAVARLQAPGVSGRLAWRLLISVHRARLTSRGGRSPPSTVAI